MVLARLQHKPGHPHDCPEGRLEKSRGFASPPSPFMESLIKKAPIVLLPFFPVSFLETGWLYQNGVSLLGYPVLHMIII